MSDRARYIVGGIMAVVLAASLIYLQGLFDKSDHRKAIAKVRQMQTRPGVPTFGGHLAATTSGAVSFSATLLSGLRGIVQVDAHPESGGLLSFKVDLIKQEVEPLNGAARRSLDEYREAWPEEASAPGDPPLDPEAPTPQVEGVAPALEASGGSATAE